MSITVYDGFKATDTDAFTAARRIREVLEPPFLSAFAKLYARVIDAPQSSTWSDLHLDVIGEKDSAIANPALLHHQIVKLHKSFDWSPPEVNIAYDVMLHPNGTGGEPLVLVFGENARCYRKRLVEAGVVTDYGYWNSADEEEGVSASEWDERRAAWNQSVEAEFEDGLLIEIPGSITSVVWAQEAYRKRKNKR